MRSLGETIRELRNERELPLRTVADHLGIDQAILSKIERGLRRPKRELVVRLAAYFQISEKDLLLAWLADKITYELGDEELALEALQMAEERAAYAAFQKIDRDRILRKIQNGISKFKQVKKAWIYGSFARQDDGPKSDVDIAVQADPTFSYFDLVDIQYALEKTIDRKVDIGFIDSFKPYIFEQVKKDLKLIYER
ncbi:XRE family transcriptional regulator [Cyclobacterium salsum]|uniref:XRE family transcriptional regulator n=1 Tax=Cyclobacterium salsum TaxID=2666329 RepID=UPI00139197CD|nr:XRE family transcriptional regulator [Cyclobacterium salsum]